MICGFEHFFFSIFLTWHVLTQWLYEFIMRSSFHILDMVNLDPYFQKLCLLQFFIKVLQITTLAKLFEVYLHFSYHHDTSSAIIHFSTKIIGCQMSKIMSVFLPGFEKWIYTPPALTFKVSTKQVSPLLISRTKPKLICNNRRDANRRICILEFSTLKTLNA